LKKSGILNAGREILRKTCRCRCHRDKGQTLTEFMLVFVVLLIATSGVFAIYKKFWKTKYEKISVISGIAVSTVKTSGSQASYVK
jgi:uncharacterized protein (UPF0333 family)